MRLPVLQTARLTLPDHDPLIALGRGLGTEALRAAASWLLGPRGHHRLTIDPAASNTRAIRTYRAIGFRPIGRLRRGQRGLDGRWHDTLLMDLLAEELVTPEGEPDESRFKKT